MSLADNDDGMVRDVGRGDLEALTRLYDRYGDLVYSLLCRILTPSPEADEAFVETWARIRRSSPGYDPGRSTVVVWVLAIARTCACERLRPEARIEYSEPRPVVNESAHPAPHIRRALDTLPASERRALELAYFHGWSRTEIAESIDIPADSVNTWLRTGLERLRLSVRSIEPAQADGATSESTPSMRYAHVTDDLIRREAARVEKQRREEPPA